MPGITGIISRNSNGLEEKKLKLMLDSMLHEPFYSHGTYANRDINVFIGYVSLEGSYSDCMPIFNEKKDLILFFTGECYLDSDVFNELQKKGHVFQRGNASFLIHLYEELGIGFLNNLNGWYNGILIDLKNKKIWLFNDRYGIRRIYYHENKDTFIFSSEAKSLLKAFPQLRELDPKSIGEYITYDCVLENRTYFSGISLLPPTSVWKFEKGQIERKKYFDFHILEDQVPLSKERFFEELSATYQRILPRYFSGNSIGLSLTGGLDTRMILASLKPAVGELPCYTFGGKDRDIFDVRLASRVAKACDQSHQVLKFSDTYLSEYPFHVNRSIYISDGLECVDKADVIYFNKLARDIAPIRMTGIYGSQVLKNIAGLKERIPYIKLIDPDFQKYLSLARENFRSIAKENPLSFMLFNEIAWWWNGFIASQSSQITVRSPYLDYDLIKVLYQKPPDLNDFGTNFQINFIKRCNPKLLLIPTSGTYGGSSSVIVSAFRKKFMKFLIKVDLVHVRERIPHSDFLTHFVGKIDYMLSPIHAERLLTGYFDYRRYRVWFRDQLSPFLKETLLTSRTLTRPYWNTKFLEKVVNDHTNGRGTYLREIRKVLQIELIQRNLIENI